MSKNNHQKLINPKKYQVFVLCCPCNIPFNFISHSWFVCNEKGKISRWEVLFRPNKNKKWGHLHLNRFNPFSGIEILPFSSKFYWKVRLLKQIDGDLAKKMIEFIKKSRENYPYKKYSSFNANCNTYTQWVLDKFKKLKLKLPWNSLGKNTV